MWNIADILVGSNKYLPLEKDSVDILESLGMIYGYRFRAAMEGIFLGQKDLVKMVNQLCRIFVKSVINT